MWLAPLGEVEVVAPIARGAWFEVSHARYLGRDVAIKSPAGTPAAGAGFVGASSGIATSLWGGSTTDTDEVAATPAVLAAVLALEAERIRQAGDAWHHAVVALGHWDPDVTVDPGDLDLGARGRLALVMPRHPGTPLAALDPDDQRAVLPRLLPGLWAALAACPHGDVSASNVVVAPDRARFALIDPGVHLASRRGKDGWGGGWANLVELVTCNADGYALLPPFLAGVRADASAPTPLLGLLRPLAELATTVGVLGIAGAPRPGDRPWPADLHALGVVYYRALCGAHPLTGAAASPAPAWLGSFHEIGQEAAQRLAAAIAQVERGFPPPSAVAPARRIRPAEDALALALLDLRVGSAAELEALVGAAAG